MCDTLGAIEKNIVLFGKNSDRCVGEPQIVEFHKAKINQSSTLKATYIEIEQVKETKAVLLSRPSWMWGAEMGVNQCGITTEAVKEIQRYAFLELGLDIMAVDHYPNNRRSMRVIEKCGFKLEGTIRMGRPDYEGKPMDIVCYSILKDEWMKNNRLI